MSDLHKLILTLILLLLPMTVGAYTFNTNLSVGMNHPDVKELQKELNKRVETQVASTGPGSLGNETTYFGPLTKAAVIRYQNLFSGEILHPVGLYTGTGYVGKSTRDYLNMGTLPDNLQESIDHQSTDRPIIDSISPDEGISGEKLVITGENFTDSNTVFFSFDPVDRYIEIPSSSGGTRIVFELDSDISRSFNQQIAELSEEDRETVYEEFLPLELGISVFNENGISDIVPFTLHMR